MNTKPKPEGYVFGRPPKFTKKEFAEKVQEYIQERKYGSEKGPLTVLDFCCFIGVDKHYISSHDLGNGKSSDFSASIKILKTECEKCLEYYGLMGKLNPTMAIFALKNNYGWTDSREITGKDGAPFGGVSVNIITQELDEQS